MISLLQRLLDPDYLYALDPGPLGRWGAVYVAWAILLLLGGVAAARWLKRTHALAALSTTMACLAGLAFLTLRLLAPRILSIPPDARFLLLEAWTARVWPLSATLLALLVPAISWLGRLRRPSLLCRMTRPLTGTLGPEDSPMAFWPGLCLYALHLAGLGWLWHSAGLSFWWAIPSLILLSLLPLSAPPRRLRPETLTPLFLSYASSLIAFALSQKLHLDIAEYQGFALPDPWSPWFNAPVTTVAGVGYTVWIQARLAAQRWPARIRESIVPAALLVTTTLWMAATVVVHRTRGVTASDPYCYVQTAVDLAETGSPLHEFPLAGLARDLSLPTWPTVHIGYQPPVSGNRSPTMWPIGWPLLLVPFYWLGGLDLLYWAAPLVAALSLVVVWFMTNETLSGYPTAVRRAVAALTCFLVATSPEGSERILVPMADAAAQLFTLLTLWLLLRSLRTRPMAHLFVAGLCLGLAYFVRHPQLPLGIAAGAAVWAQSKPLKSKLGLLAAFGLGALIASLPDLLYHQAVFGSWLKSESTEWFLLSGQNIGRAFFTVVEQGLLRREELGFVAPLVLYGGWRLWHTHRRAAALLELGFLAVFAFHLFYAALRPRDLIAVLPILYLCAAYGLVSCARLALNRRSLLGGTALLCMALCLSARSYRTLAMPWRDDVITFGHLSTAQRQALQTLADLTPPGSIIGSMLNGGAIELYAHRTAIHPAPWTPEQLAVWLSALLEAHRPVYMLDDGEEMAALLGQFPPPFALVPIQALELPYFAYGGGNLPRTARLFQVIRRQE